MHRAKKHPPRLVLAFLAVAAAGFLACEEDKPVSHEEPCFSGILRVDEQGNVLGGDTTDFQPRPEGPPTAPTNYSLIYARPNPVDAAATTQIRFQIPVADSVIIQFYACSGEPPVGVLYDAQTPAGVHEIAWMGSGLQGIYRVEMLAVDGAFRSYGDVQFSP